MLHSPAGPAQGHAADAAGGQTVRDADERKGDQDAGILRAVQRNQRESHAPADLLDDSVRNL